MIEFSCENCRRHFSVPESYAGRRAACKTCGSQIVVPIAAVDADDSETMNGSNVIRQATASIDDVSRREIMSSTNSHSAANVSRTGRADGNSSEDSAIDPENSTASQLTPTKTPVRIRRLMADARQMRTVFETSPFIQVICASGNPPDLYKIKYNIQSLTRGHGSQPVPCNQHMVEIQLTRDYPRQSPKCRMLTPIFHPNIEPAVICVGDHWTASERLTDLVIRIGEMIAYQAYNIKSPLDGEAAMWADLNRSQLPTDKRDLRPPEPI